MLLTFCFSNDCQFYEQNMNNLLVIDCTQRCEIIKIKKDTQKFLYAFAVMGQANYKCIQNFWVSLHFFQFICEDELSLLFNISLHYRLLHARSCKRGEILFKKS